ncbi:MAG: hypothetical protein KZQ94_16095 [Candidatus Thiodiazotropha sp. (ex Troendleina suluensis)]|nr:hypothetical protein [Candidatus Thiodiazotropha sp. (ex Troendleina suluensis)]
MSKRKTESSEITHGQVSEGGQVVEIKCATPRKKVMRRVSGYMAELKSKTGFVPLSAIRKAIYDTAKAAEEYAIKLEAESPAKNSMCIKFLAKIAAVLKKISSQ